VISRASWNLTRGDFPKFSPGSEEFTAWWKAARQRLQIPRYFQICRHDQELLIDSDNSFSLALLKEAIYKNGKVRIVEILQEPGEGFVGEDGKHYANEVVIPFRPVTVQPSPATNVRVPGQQQRRFMTASSWLFVKIYVGTSTADRILLELIGPYCNKMISEGKLQKWFFIRYQDPDHHLRIRFYHGDQTDFWQPILKDLQALLSGWLESGLVLKMQTDTYTRELERYQGFDYRQVESIFYADTHAVIRLIDMLCEHEQPDVERWLVALSGADILLDDLGLTLDEKLGLIGGLHRHLQEELCAGADLTIQLDKQYRSHRDMIAAYMQRRPSRVCQIFSERSMRIKQILEGGHGSPRPGIQVAASFVHMFFNRVFASAQRQQELVMYHYLNKYYKALIVRAKNGLKAQKKPAKPFL
jgi:thiopeptide-type bacteriocin biosynthesis protein